MNVSQASLPRFSALRSFFIFSDGKTPFDIVTNSFSEGGFIKVSVSIVFNEETDYFSLRIQHLVRSLCFAVWLEKLMSWCKHCLNSA